MNNSVVKKKQMMKLNVACSISLIERSMGRLIPVAFSALFTETFLFVQDLRLGFLLHLLFGNLSLVNFLHDVVIYLC